MPFELGIFLAAKKFGGKTHSDKIGLILDKERFRYQKYLSDIAGQDIRSHNDKPENAIKAVRDWLATSDRTVTMPGTAVLKRRYRKFQQQLPKMCKDLHWKVNEISHSDYEHLVSTWLSKNAAF
jgi:hypothetical protein